jgi:hypothetical protein
MGEESSSNNGNGSQNTRLLGVGGSAGCAAASGTNRASDRSIARLAASAHGELHK